MFVFVAVIHIVLCLSLMGLVMLQQGKGADAGAIMGGSGDSLLGAGSAGSVISKITTSLAIGFMITSIVLVKFYDQGMAVRTSTQRDVMQGSLLEKVAAPVAEEKQPDEQAGALNQTAPIENQEAGDLKVEPAGAANAEPIAEQPIEAENNQ